MSDSKPQHQTQDGQLNRPGRTYSSTSWYRVTPPIFSKGGVDQFIQNPPPSSLISLHLPRVDRCAYEVIKVERRRGEGDARSQAASERKRGSYLIHTTVLYSTRAYSTIYTIHTVHTGYSTELVLYGTVRYCTANLEKRPPGWPKGENIAPATRAEEGLSCCTVQQSTVEYKSTYPETLVSTLPPNRKTPPKTTTKTKNQGHSVETGQPPQAFAQSRIGAGAIGAIWTCWDLPRPPNPLGPFTWWLDGGTSEPLFYYYYYCFLGFLRGRAAMEGYGWRSGRVTFLCMVWYGMVYGTVRDSGVEGTSRRRLGPTSVSPLR